MLDPKSFLFGFRNCLQHQNHGRRERKDWATLARANSRASELLEGSTLRRLASFALMLVLLVGSTPQAIAASLAAEAVARFNASANSIWTNAKDWLKLEKSLQGPVTNRGKKPREPETKTEREGRLASLRVNPTGDVVLQKDEPMLFTAVPLDRDGAAIHGLQAEWETSNHLVVAIKKTGQATAGKPGRATLTVRVGKLKQEVQVTVVTGTAEKFGGKKTQDSTRRGKRIAQFSGSKAISPSSSSVASRTRSARHHALTPGKTNPGMEAPVPLRDPNDDPLPDNETGSLYQPSNLIGSPVGRRRAGAATASSATDGTESGNRNFSFAVPIADLSGRGLDVSLRLVHNSQVFNKSTDPYDSSTWMTYDVDSSWPATGWRLTLGQIEDQGSYGFTLSDSDGTRHALVYTSAYNYDSIDGSFIHFYGGSGWGIAYYPDGTQIYYGASGGGYRSYPTQITDRNGNYVLISYAGTNGAGPKISSIVDTLGRYVNFYYASNGDLVTITAPGMTGQSDLQVMRFYYTDVSISSSGLFGSGINVSAPASVHTLQYLYLGSATESGDAHLGYRFDYNVYGTMYQTVQFRGMTVSSTSTNSAGSVSSEGSQAAITTYDYPSTASALTDVPTYTHRTDDWAGRTTSVSGNPPAYTFAVNESTGVSTVTAPDGTVNETHSIVNAGQWDDGLISDTYIQYGSGPTVLAHTHLDWQQDSGSLNPRVYQVRTTDEAGLTKATVIGYGNYNNISSVSERDFTTDGSVSSTELRRTETTYVSSSDYLYRHLLHLASTVKIFPGGSSTPVSRVDYGYDNYGSSHNSMTARDDIIMHDSSFDPFAPSYEVQGDCAEWDYWQINCLQWNYYWVTDYNPATDFRGNVTSVTTYPDASSTSGTITRNSTYDIAGNLMSVEVDCCTLKSITYSGAGGNHDYAYPISINIGNPSGINMTSSATYDYNSGLLATTTDENSQVITFYYNTDSLRLDHVAYPDGGVTYTTYSDGLAADANGKYHFYIKESSKLDAPGGTARYADSYRYFDGRGAVARTLNNNTSADGWSTQDLEYDVMGRAYRASNPYFSSGPSAAINPDGFWTTSAFDHLGRVTQVTMPRGDNDNSLTTSVQTEYAGIFTTVTDQSGKSRRQKLDALGRLIRVDEPNSSNQLGSTSSPNQSTNYYFDALNNVVHINQGSQDRYFKYDSLSRMIRERQVEQTANSSYDLSDSLTGNSSWTRKIDYNSRGRVTDSYDARGVHTTFSYDDLNRVTTITYSDSTPTAHFYYDSQSLPSGAPSYTHSNSTGRLLAMVYGSGATGNYFAYDSMGRVVTQKQVTGSTTYGLSYSYNYAGLLTSETYPTSRVLSYSYDEGGRLSGISDGTTTFANSFTYAPHGGMASETWSNGAVHSLSYNRRMQTSEVKLKQSSSGSELQRYNYSYGEVTQSNGSVDTTKNTGQIGRVDGYLNGGSTKEWDQRFTYDELGRLSTAAEYQQGNNSLLTWQTQYTYDRYGNRFQSGSSNTGIAYTPVTSGDINAATNRFINSGSTPTTYDNAGNVTQDTKFRGMNYAYDANGRMTSASRTDNTGGQSSTYDAGGQRVRTSANNVTRTMVYDVFGQIVADYLGSTGSTLQRENIYRGGQLLAVYEAGGSCYKSISQFVKDFYQGVLQRQPTTTELNSAVASLTQAQAQGQGQLIGAAQSLGSTLFNSSEYASLNTSNAQFLTDLYVGYLQRSPDPSGYNFWLGLLNGGSNRADIRQAFAVCSEFQENVSSLCVTTSSTSASLKYVLADAMGTTRAVMNNSGVGSSTVIVRHDYLPFGEEIWSGTGTRTGSQGYGATDSIRQKYSLTERDDATGLDHTWWRKYESFSGRWTTPDPMLGSLSIQNPQSVNRYAYVGNDPINFSDPSGLFWAIDYGSCQTIGYITINFDTPRQQTFEVQICGVYWVGPIGGGPVGGGGPGGGVIAKPPQQKKKECSVKPLAEVTDPDAYQLEDTGGTAIDTEHLTQATQNGLNCLEGAVRSAGGTFALHSGYRPQAYQEHLAEVWDKWQLLRNNNQSECQNTKNAVRAEMNTHHLTERPCVSGANCPHVEGRAFDATVTLPARLPRGVSFGTMLTTCGVYQPRPGADGGHHFQPRP